MNGIRRALSILLLVALALAGAGFVQAADRSDAPENTLCLTDGWRIQSAAQAGADAAVAAAGLDSSAWKPASVPTTVLAALVKDGVYKDIYFDRNLAQVPTAPFNGPWWFRKEIELTARQAAQNADLIFEGINYRADIWINGEPLAKADQTFGSFRVFSFDVSGRLKAGKNVLAVKVTPPASGELTMGFVDWNPKPPDKNLGLWRPVKLHFFKTVGVDHLNVESKIDHATWKKAELTVDATLTNRSAREVQTTIRCQIGKITFDEPVALKAGETRAIQLTPARHPELKLNKPRLWWPWDMGEPYLYPAKLTAFVDCEVADQQSIKFGIREAADFMSPEGYRGYTINGRKVLLRGGGWTDDMLLAEDAKNVEAQVLYTRAMNLNTIRLEGIWGSSQSLFDLCDKYGVLLMVGWSHQWDQRDLLGDARNPNPANAAAKSELLARYMRDQVLWLRHHPSIFVWATGSDSYPQTALEKKYIELMAQIDPTRPMLISCARKTSKLTGPSGAKMNGPYDYVTPNYWYVDTRLGGAYGFNTETGPGPQPPPLESLQRMIPQDKLWPIGEAWNYHCAMGTFKNLDVYMNAFNARYGACAGVEEFALKSQAANYEAIRPMYEAFACNLPRTTGVIQWMLNSAWPKMFWQLYDYYLMPGGAFYGTMKGAAPLSIVYNYGDGAVYLTNQGAAVRKHLHATITAWDLNSKKILTKKISADAPAFGSKKILDLAGLKPATPVYFVNLELSEGWLLRSKVIDNFYWISKAPDVLDDRPSERDWYMTPNSAFADFTALGKLPAATVRAKATFKKMSGGGLQAKVTLTNPGDKMAFFIESRIVGTKSGRTLLPVLWDDNYVSLPPGAKKVLNARILDLPAGEEPVLKIQGWNIKPGA